MPTKLRAVSLIDSLVVVAIVAVVAGVLAPGLSNTKTRRIRDLELARLRDLAATLQAYAMEDPNNILGPIHSGAPGFVGEGYAEYGGGPGNSFFVGWGASFGPENRPLNLLLYGYSGRAIPPERQTEPGDRSVYREFQCAGNDLGWQAMDASPFLPEETDVPYFDSYGTSFRLNNLFAIPNDIGYGIYGRPTSRIPAPSETVEFMESRVFQTMVTSPNSPYFGGESLDLTGFHGKRAHFMLTYADGHASFEYMGSDSYIDASSLAFGVRGSWGRMDCSEDPMANP
ncbi:MAG TPA: hypothetical protein P5081_07525 [Phycisphaerae bacterium]|nr:hypothetical protein [Phycisphaerae bacterium]HRW52721.1 hypothetical protein [Phycisphaerae bacterium]